MIATIQTKSADDTILIGKMLGNVLRPKDLILLNGDLGAGKTTFTKGIALALNIRRPVKSPTFTLIREYKEGTYPLYHMDMYRLENGGSEELGLEEYFNGDGIVVVEWSQFIEAELPENYLVVELQKDPDHDDARTIVFKPRGSHYEKLVQEVQQAYGDKA